MEVKGERCGDLAYVEISGRGYQSVLQKVGELAVLTVNGKVPSLRVLRVNIKAVMSVINVVE
jgi:sorbitol-specific phosphotransferase system component IIC